MSKSTAYPYPPRTDCFSYRPNVQTRSRACIALDDLYCAKDGKCAFFAHPVTKKLAPVGPRHPKKPHCCEMCGEVFPEGTTKAKKQCDACRVKTQRFQSRYRVAHSGDSGPTARIDNTGESGGAGFNKRISPADAKTKRSKTNETNA
ncbi:MAG: hypothetical protein LBK23_04690 [Oscillospiraceae bacterium]|nr:hypothetical protein [Oscillospiraceae bacterium]